MKKFYKDLTLDQRQHLNSVVFSCARLETETTHLAMLDPLDYHIQYRICSDDNKYEFYDETASKLVKDIDNVDIYEIPEDFNVTTGKAKTKECKQYHLHLFTSGESHREFSAETLTEVVKLYKNHYQGMLVEHLSALVLEKQDHILLRENDVNHAYVECY